MAPRLGNYRRMRGSRTAKAWGLAGSGGGAARSLDDLGGKLGQRPGYGYMPGRWQTESGAPCLAHKWPPILGCAIVDILGEQARTYPFSLTYVAAGYLGSWTGAAAGEAAGTGAGAAGALRVASSMNRW